MREHLFFPPPSMQHYICYPDFIGGYKDDPTHAVQRSPQTNDLKLNQLYNLHFILDGSGYVTWSGTRFELGAGTGFLYGPGLSQYYEAAPHDPWNIRWIHFATHGMEALLGARGLGEVWLFELEDISAVNQRMEELLQLGRAFDLDQEIRASVVLYELLLHIIKGASPLSFPRDPAIPNIYAAADYIRSHCTQSLSVADLAEFTGYSVPYFSRKFHQFMGKTVTAYVLESRILHAKQLLVSTNKTIKDIAFASGFSQSSYFIQCFRKVVHMTPEQFRASCRP
ncbi:helix-turn-helix transcriptional regulator [Paenibacillus massiliensis]|uniref:helix-turn-helix transcriptional regulator n=1 Tax=Paenibacillus massiliensis TaxID=225917 RepID=UPI0004726999|nr:AraC family transcriptional regulator [Paenibacillus massiliensis]